MTEQEWFSSSGGIPAAGRLAIADLIQDGFAIHEN